MPRPRNRFSLATLFVCALIALAPPAGAAGFPGLKRDGEIYVPVRAVASAFGVELYSTRSVHSLLLKSGERSACVSFGETCAAANVPAVRAIFEDGETYVPLEATRRILGIDAHAKLDLDLADRSDAQARDRVSLRTWKFSPATGARTNEALSLAPKKTLLVVIDFWEDHRNDNPSYDNAAALIFLARRQGIPVVHLPHDGPATGGLLNPRILPLPEGEVVLRSESTIERYLRAKSLDVETILFAGFNTSECVLFTRMNSMNNVALRNPGKWNLVLVKDATAAPQWQYEFAVNGVETKYRTTTIDDLATATNDDARAVPVAIKTEAPWSYRLDYEFGKNVDLAKTALLVINAWKSDADAQWLARVKENTSKNLAPLLDFARQTGMKIVHVPNGHPIDPAVAPLPNELVATSEAEIRKYLVEQGVTTVLHAGNLINTTALFSPMDLASFTTDFRPSVVTRILSDCLIVYETPASMPDKFLRVFLERATAYGGEQHSVTTFALLQKNVLKTKKPGREVRPGSETAAAADQR